MKFGSLPDSTMPKAKKLKVTAAQIDCLCTFFEENPEIITGYKKTPSCIKAVQIKWKKITPHLNTLGLQKDEKQWAKYLSDMKAKLKKKRIKWKQNRDGSGPIICNADDFSEIGLRMLQVLKMEVNKLQVTENGNASESEKAEDNIKSEQEDSSKCVALVESLKENKTNDRTSNENHTELNGKPPTPQVFINPKEVCIGDEFDMFGKNITQQLRALPLTVALETQEMLLSIIHKQRLKCMKDIEDPLDKKNN